MPGPDPASPPLSTESTVARILLFAGAAFAGVVALFLLLFLAWMLATVQEETPVQRVEFFFPWSLFMLFALAALAGIGLNLVAATQVPKNPRQAGILAIIAAFLPPTNLFSIAGAVLVLVSPESKEQANPSGAEATQEG